MLFKKKKNKEETSYSLKQREYDRDERIALQKIVSGTPVTRKLIPQEKLTKLTYNYIARNIRIGSIAAQNVNTTKFPQVFFKSLRELIVTTENLVRIEKIGKRESVITEIKSIKNSADSSKIKKPKGIDITALAG